MKGSILFNKDINIEVDVDPSAEEGARLISAKNLVDGQEAGGGGDSDFTIANVTITTTALNYSVPYMAENQGIEFIAAGSTSNSGDLQVPLYKGNAIFSTEEPLTIAVTGSITPIIEGQVYLISGDGTITISD